MIRQCKARKWSRKIVDSTGTALSGGALLARMLALRSLFLREVLGSDERFVGVLLPPSAPGVVVNGMLPLAGRIPVNLNYTATQEIINHCIRQAGIRHIITSRRFCEKFSFQLEAELVYLEDLPEKITRVDKAKAALQAYATPSFWLERLLGLLTLKGDDILTVIFTSGSTGQPKGVMLTYDNIGHNVHAIEACVQLTSRDVLLGVLPLFHSFGFAVTLWTVLGLDVGGCYHFSPLDAKIVGKLCRATQATILLCTPTFLRGYVRRCPPEDFKSLEVVVVGAEKMPAELFEQFEKTFGVRPAEGYGTTELSPLVSVNIPANRAVGGSRDGLCEGSVGRPVPQVEAKIVDPESGQPLPSGTAGMLLIRGPNVMKGYLGQPELTAKVLHDGWYTTGDIAYLDAGGFIHITGRLSRFSKIGGEMVPHGKIEEELLRLVASSEQGVPLAVTAVPDEKKGERLVVLHLPMSHSPEELCKALAGAGFPNLWIPSPDAFVEVAEIPVLGTGKLDLRGIKRLASEKCKA
jgi:acyl-[acyl-carrier-protein]-phospholipid O-acyltransferase/long-chain-fatty-acid--[acyl-carrier-protein] ligase